MVSRPKRAPATPATQSRPPELFRKLIAVAMELERRTMQLYCCYESLFSEPDEVRAFWFDMAEHESRHYGALAMVAGMLECVPGRTLPAAPTLGIRRRSCTASFRSSRRSTTRTNSPSLGAACLDMV